VRREFQRALCAYCGEAPATAGDHVFARKFFLETDRDNLPQSPACDICNGKKSALEGYLTIALPFAGRHAQAAENLMTGVPSRLKGNRKVARKIFDAKPAWLREAGGIYQLTSVVDFDGDKLAALLEYVARGLAWHHWRVYLRPTDHVSVLFVRDIETALLQSLIAGLRPGQQVNGNLGNGTVLYRGLQGVDPPQLTVWTVSMYGGVVLSDDRRSVDRDAESCTVWWMFTGPPELHNMLSTLGLVRSLG